MFECVDCGAEVLVELLPDEAKGALMRDGKWYHVRDGQLYECVVVCVECAKARTPDMAYAILKRNDDESG